MSQCAKILKISNEKIVCAITSLLWENDFGTNIRRIKTITDEITRKIGVRPVSHRAGRWATNKEYLSLLVKYGYKVDCSFTPHIDWSKTKGMSKNSKGSNYRWASEFPFSIKTSHGTILELPMTIRKRTLQFKGVKSLRSFLRWIYRLFFPLHVWLRPNRNNIDEILSMMEKEKNSKSDYLMFMIHSSELMPGGSPSFPTANDVDCLYHDVEEIFKKASEFCVGKTISEYMHSYFF